MKKNLLLMATAILLSVCGYAQTKGTNTLGLGIASVTSKRETTTLTESFKRSNQLLSLGYGHFISDNVKLGIELSYGRDKLNSEAAQGDRQETQMKSYGGAVNYQQYYPIVKTLYAYAGGAAGYNTSKRDASAGSPDYRLNKYTLGAYGGLTWFASKRFAFETTLLSADFRYENSKSETLSDDSYQNTTTDKSSLFSLSTSGLIDGLGFKIYLLF